MYVAGDMPIHLADEPQGEVELIFALPACVPHATHQAGQQVSDRRRRTNGNEQAVHGEMAINRDLDAARTGFP